MNEEKLKWTCEFNRIRCLIIYTLTVRLPTSWTEVRQARGCDLHVSGRALVTSVPRHQEKKKIINSRWNMHSLTSACCHLSRNSEKKRGLLNLPGFHLVLDLLDKKRENFETVYAYYKDCLDSCRGIWINKSKWTTSVSLGYYLNV